MLYFFLGVIMTLILVAVILRFVFKGYYRFLIEARKIYQDLTQLYEKCQEISESMVRDLEDQITQGKNILMSLEEKIACASKDFTKNTSYYPTLPTKEKEILKLAGQGLSIKEIARRLGVEQDRVTFVLQLYKDFLA